MSDIQEISLESLNPEEFIAEKLQDIARAVGTGTAINALSGGVDSSVVTLLGHRALGDRLLSCFIDTGLMRQDEPETIRDWFGDLGVPVTIVDAKDAFFSALKGLTDPEEKRRPSPIRSTRRSLESLSGKAVPGFFSRGPITPTWKKRSPGSSGSTTSWNSSASTRRPGMATGCLNR